MRYAAILLLVACTTVDDGPDGGEERDGSRAATSCEQACARLQALGCESGEPADDGSECSEGCEDLEHILPGEFHTGCVSAADSCDQADACFE